MKCRATEEDTQCRPNNDLCSPCTRVTHSHMYTYTETHHLRIRPNQQLVKYIKNLRNKNCDIWDESWLLDLWKCPNGISTFSGGANIVGGAIHSPLPPFVRRNASNAVAGVSLAPHLLSAQFIQLPTWLKASQECQWLQVVHVVGLQTCDTVAWWNGCLTTLDNHTS